MLCLQNVDFGKIVPQFKDYHASVFRNLLFHTDLKDDLVMVFSVLLLNAVSIASLQILR